MIKYLTVAEKVRSVMVQVPLHGCRLSRMADDAHRSRGDKIVSAPNAATKYQSSLRTIKSPRVQALVE